MISSPLASRIAGTPDKKWTNRQDESDITSRSSLTNYWLRC
jgi:hypothetical protein